jgi:carboxymethylenebutenolidase
MEMTAYRYFFFAAVCLLIGTNPSIAAVSQREVSIATKAAGALTGTLYVSDQPGAKPGVLVLHTAGGLSDADRMHAHNFAEAGFTALVVSYRIGWTASMNDGLAEAVDWLRQQPESRNMPVGVVGYSLGATKALIVAALRPKAVKAAVSYYGTYNVEISKFKQVARQVREKTGAPTPSPVEMAGRIEAAVLLLQGGDDDETPPDQTAQMRAALDRAKVKHEVVIYPGAVHMFERELRFHPPGRRTNFGTATAYDATAAKDSWAKTVDWLNRYLRSVAN